MSLAPNTTAPGIMPSPIRYREPLQDAELEALRRYKIESEALNLDLRLNQNENRWTQETAVLDAALAKGVSIRQLRLYRATSREYVPEADAQGFFRDRGYCSTSLSSRERGTHFRHSTPNPLLLVLQCPDGVQMSHLEFDDTGESEDEILLPRNSRFQILARKTITVQRKMQKAARISAFYTREWDSLYVYYCQLVAPE
jgi:hypothetical protein